MPSAQAAELALRLRGSSLAAGLAAGEPGAGPCYNPGTSSAPGSGATAPVVPLFTVSCVTGAAIPLLHAFLAALQPARAGAGAPDRVQNPSPGGARPAAPQLARGSAAAGAAADAAQGSASTDTAPVQSARGLSAADACARELSAQVGCAPPGGRSAQAAQARHIRLRPCIY